MRVSPRTNRLILTLLCLAVLATSGCVRRRMTVRSNPSGAFVYIDDQEIGTTPVSTQFTYYGTRKIRLVKDGYETVTTLVRVPPPWYQIPPLDFFAENVVGREIRDERILDFTMEPLRAVSTDELLGRANGLRQGNTQGVIVPSPTPDGLPGLGVRRTEPNSRSIIGPQSGAPTFPFSPPVNSLPRSIVPRNP